MKILEDEFDTMVESELTPRRIDAWLTEHVDWAPAAKNRYRSLISLVYRQAMRHGKAERNPARLVAACQGGEGDKVLFPRKLRDHSLEIDRLVRLSS